MLTIFRNSLCAGLLIAIGGSAFLGCESRYVGAALFSVGLLSICYKGYFLFTGRIGYVVSDHSKAFVNALIAGLAGNLIAAGVTGLAVGFAISAQAETARGLCALKLAQALPQTFIRSVLCGVLMYLAVSIFKENKTALGVLFSVPAFILSGFEHSIADMFYFAAAGIFDLEALAFILIVILGNTAGGVLLPLLGGDGVKKSE